MLIAAPSHHARWSSSSSYLTACKLSLVRSIRHCNLLRVINLDPGYTSYLLHGAGCANCLPLKVFGRVGHAGRVEALGAFARDDNCEVLGVLEILLGVQVDFAAFLQSVLRGFHFHL